MNILILSPPFLSLSLFSFSLFIYLSISLILFQNLFENSQNRKNFDKNHACSPEVTENPKMEVNIEKMRGLEKGWIFVDILVKREKKKSNHSSFVSSKARAPRAPG